MNLELLLGLWVLVGLLLGAGIIFALAWLLVIAAIDFARR